MSSNEAQRAGPLSRAFGFVNDLAGMKFSFFSQTSLYGSDECTKIKNLLILRHHSDDSEVEDVADMLREADILHSRVGCCL